MFNNLREDIKSFNKHHGSGVFPKIYYPMFSAVVLFRFQVFLYKTKILRPFSYCIVRLNDFLFGIWIGPKVTIGPGLFLAHARGLVVNPDTVIGKNCTILQRVTLGGPNISIGDNVLIGANAQIISRRGKGSNSLTIGDNVKIGAGAIVINDIESNKTAVGNPARTL